MYMLDTHVGQKRATGKLELVFMMVVTHYVDVGD